KARNDPAAYVMGMLTLDLETGEFVMKDYENFEVAIISTVVNPVRRNEVYGVYTTLSKIDLDKPEVVKRINLDHTYYDVNIASDGGEIYIGGTMSDIAVYSTDNLDKLGSIEMPGGRDMALASLRLIQR
ncbi:MAG: quinohemoprotein amine dehydrogenase subunit beta, partial [Gammaproteobacteria bacterium]